MKLDFSVGSNPALHQIGSQAIIILLPVDAQRRFTLKGISVDLYAHIEAAIQDGDFKPTAGYCLLLRRLSELKAPRLFLVGIDDVCAASTRKAMNTVVKTIEKYGITKAAISLECLAQVSSRWVEGAVVAAAECAYEYTLTKTRHKKADAACRIQFVGADVAVMKEGVARGTGIAAGVTLTREWGNRPANYATPTMLANAAKALSKAHPRHIQCQILGPKEVQKLGMGAFMAVAQGSNEPLRFVVMKYNGAAAKQAPVVLVGKGITFDSGGISLKPAAGMDEMKFDMCGAASVLGVFAALAQLKPKVNVVGLIAACENLPDGKSVKPGDVVTSMSGQTIEVLNTDAEGRLVLCDALTYAKRFKPQVMIDIATLTGACVVALGKVNSGLFSNDEWLQEQLVKAGKQASDPCWPLPLEDEYAEALKSNFADIANVGGRDGGAITAAMFLKQFVENNSCKWAHLDIAGTAWRSGIRKGATGRPVPLLLNFLLDYLSPDEAKNTSKGHKPGKLRKNA